MRRRPGPAHLLLALLAVLALFAAGCGDDGDSSPVDSGDDNRDDGDTDNEDSTNEDSENEDGDDTGSDGDRVACGLLTAGEIEDLGYEIESGPNTSDLIPSDECSYGVFDSRGGIASVAVTYYTESESVALGPDLYDGSITVAGIGEVAWYVDGLRLAQARLGNGRVVSVQDVPGELGQDGLVELLRLAVART